MRLTQDDELKINGAIRDAEKKTSGEILCIYTDRVSDYAEVALGYAAGVALLLPLALVAAGLRPWAVEEMLAGWRLGGAEPSPEAGALAYAMVQAVIFVAMLALMAIKPLRLWLTPEPLRRNKVHRAAVQQFLAKGLHQTEARTGVLIFASAADRHAEVVADEGIYKKVDQEVWADAIEALGRGMKRKDPATGFVDAIALCGAVLAEHFPPSAANPNELPDEIVQL